MKKMSFVRISLLLFIGVCSMAGELCAQKVQPYLPVSQLPDLIKCLPAPPSFDSPEFANDVVRYQWGKQQRLNPERAAIARRDAVWTFEALFAEFSEPFGLQISQLGTPEIWKLLTTSIATADQIRVAPKAYYHRLRPFEMYGEHLLSPDKEDEVRGEGSYPSGHTMRGWVTALLLAEIAPERADTIFARGWMYGESRVIEGAHWQSDVDVSRAAASIAYAALQTSSAFREQMEAAKAEYARLTAVSGKKNKYAAEVLGNPNILNFQVSQGSF